MVLGGAFAAAIGAGGGGGGDLKPRVAGAGSAFAVSVSVGGGNSAVAGGSSAVLSSCSPPDAGGSACAAAGSAPGRGPQIRPMALSVLPARPCMPIAASPCTHSADAPRQPPDALIQVDSATMAFSMLWQVTWIELTVMASVRAALRPERYVVGAQKALRAFALLAPPKVCCAVAGPRRALPSAGAHNGVIASMTLPALISRPVRNSFAGHSARNAAPPGPPMAGVSAAMTCEVLDEKEAATKMAATALRKNIFSPRVLQDRRHALPDPHSPRSNANWP